MKWFGLFTRKQTPGHMMLRIRSVCGRMDSRQWRVLADLSDEHGRGFCDLTTRQQVQLRWFTITDVPEIWHRMASVGLTSVQTGMDNVRGVCGCPAAGISPHETLDGTQAAEDFTDIFLGNAGQARRVVVLRLLLRNIWRLCGTGKFPDALLF
jgi:ferredoxin-nitrite reductase